LVELIFLTGTLCNRAFRAKARIPLIPISFAICEGTLINSKYGTLHLPSSAKRIWGNKVVYGMLFELHHAEHYKQVLAGLELSYVNGKRVNKYDVRVQQRVNIIPIKFNNLETLQRLRYEEKEPIVATAFLANTSNKLVKRLLKDYSHYVRIQSGISSSLYMELKNNYEKQTEETNYVME